MAVESIGSVLSSPETQIQQTTLGQNDLFDILLTQLTYQDPLKPLDNQEFIAQLAQFTSLEQTRQSNENLDALLTMESANQAVSLIGNEVQVDSEKGGVIGTVTTITFNQGIPYLVVKLDDGSFLNQVSLSQISVVRGGQVASDVGAAQNTTESNQETTQGA